MIGGLNITGAASLRTVLPVVSHWNGGFVDTIIILPRLLSMGRPGASTVHPPAGRSLPLASRWRSHCPRHPAENDAQPHRVTARRVPPATWPTALPSTPARPPRPQRPDETAMREILEIRREQGGLLDGTLLTSCHVRNRDARPIRRPIVAGRTRNSPERLRGSRPSNRPQPASYFCRIPQCQGQLKRRSVATGPCSSSSLVRDWDRPTPPSTGQGWWMRCAPQRGNWISKANHLEDESAIR